MIKTMTFVKRRAGTSLADFRTWYEEDYLGGLLGAPAGLEHHLRNYVVRAHRPAGWEADFDVIDERTYSSRADLDRARAADPLEAGSSEQPDDDLAWDRSLTRTFLVSPYDSEIAVSPYSFGTKLMLIMNRHDLYDRPAFQHRYESGHAVLARKMLAPALLSYQRNYLIEPLTAGWDDDFDVVTSFEFAAEIPRRGLPQEHAYLIRDEEVFMDRSSQRFVQVDPLS